MKKTTLTKVGWRVVQFGSGLLIGRFIGDVLVLTLANKASKIGKLASYAGGMLTSVCVAHQVDEFVNSKVARLTEQEDQDSEVEETEDEEFEDYLASIDNR